MPTGSIAPIVASLGCRGGPPALHVTNQIMITTPDGLAYPPCWFRPRSSPNPSRAAGVHRIYDSNNYARLRGARLLGAWRPTTLACTRDPQRRSAIVTTATIRAGSLDREATLEATPGGHYGDVYSGFTPWRPPRAVRPRVKAIATVATTAPGVAGPMGRQCLSELRHRCSLLCDHGKTVRRRTDYDDARGTSLDQNGTSAKPIPDLGVLHENPSIFIRWLNHPSYDTILAGDGPLPGRIRAHNIRCHMTRVTTPATRRRFYEFTQHHRTMPACRPYVRSSPTTRADAAGAVGPRLQGYQVIPAAPSTFVSSVIMVRPLSGGIQPPLPLRAGPTTTHGLHAGAHAPSLTAMAKGR